jgi:hypothetical protein
MKFPLLFLTSAADASFSARRLLSPALLLLAEKRKREVIFRAYQG